MTLIELAYKLRPYIEKAVALGLTDEDALEAVQLFAAWNPTATYAVGDRVRYNNVLYRCLQAHTAQEAWTPTDAPSLWAKVLIPDETQIYPWEQPDSTNPYSKGDKVMYNGKVYESTIDGNVWSPDAYPQGWKEIVE